MKPPNRDELVSASANLRPVEFDEVFKLAEEVEAVLERVWAPGPEHSFTWVVQGLPRGGLSVAVYTEERNGPGSASSYSRDGLLEGLKALRGLWL